MAENIIRANVSMGILNPLATFFLNAATLIILYLSAQRMVSALPPSPAATYWP